MAFVVCIPTGSLLTSIVTGLWLSLFTWGLGRSTPERDGSLLTKGDFSRRAYCFSHPWPLRFSLSLLTYSTGGKSNHGLNSFRWFGYIGFRFHLSPRLLLGICVDAHGKTPLFTLFFWTQPIKQIWLLGGFEGSCRWFNVMFNHDRLTWGATYHAASWRVPLLTLLPSWVY